MVHRIVFLSVVAALGVISASLCAPALPFIADHFSTGFSSIQFTISLFLVGNALGQFFSGPLSDQLGQRRVLMSGLFLYIVASCICALADKMSILLGGRFLQGMGSAVGPVLARAIATSSYPPERSAQVQSYGAIGVGIASILAILASGQLTLSSWRGNFWLAVALGIVLLFWTSITLKNANATTTPRFSFRQIFSQMKKVFVHPIFVGSAFSHSMTYGLMYGYIALFPFLLMELFHEKNPTQVGIYSAYMIGCYMAGAFFASRFVKRWPAEKLVFLGISMQIVAGGWLIFASSPLLFMGALSLFNLGIGIILPLTAACALTPFVGSLVGTASSSLGVSYRLIGSLLSTLVCQFPLVGGRNLGIAMLFLSIVSFIVFRRMMQKRVRTV